MTVGQLRKDQLHRSFPENSRTGLNIESVAVFLDCGHFVIIEVDYLTVAAPECLPALLEDVRIDCRNRFFLSGQNCLRFERYYD